MRKAGKGETMKPRKQLPGVRGWLLAAVVMLCVPLPRPAAQTPVQPAEEDEPGAADREVLQRFFVPPNLVLRHQREIGLTADQRRRITREIQQAEKELVNLRWELREAMYALGDLLEQKRPEGDILQALDRLLEAEKKVKRLRFALALRVQSELTEEQVEALRELRTPGPRRFRQGRDDIFIEP